MPLQAIELERSPTRVEIETELARVKNAPRRLMSVKESSPSSRVSNAQAEDDSDWRRSMEKNIERIMEHLQIPIPTPTKAASARSSSSSETSGTDSSSKPDHVMETDMLFEVRIYMFTCSFPGPAVQLLLSHFFGYRESVLAPFRSIVVCRFLVIDM